MGTIDHAEPDPLLRAWLERFHGRKIAEDVYELDAAYHRALLINHPETHLLAVELDAGENLFGDAARTRLADDGWEVGRIILFEGRTLWHAAWYEPGRIELPVLNDVLAELRTSDDRLFDACGRRVPRTNGSDWQRPDPEAERQAWLSEAEEWLRRLRGKVWRSATDDSLLCILDREGLQAVCLGLASSGRWAVLDAILGCPDEQELGRLRALTQRWVARFPFGKVALRRDSRLAVFSHAWPIGRRFSTQRTEMNFGAACFFAGVFVRAWRDVQRQRRNPDLAFEEAFAVQSRELEEQAFEETMNRLYGEPPEWV
ncbi:MAG: hypothetical protein ACK41F_03510 [Fimbriimonadaceae bacterium]